MTASSNLQSTASNHVSQGAQIGRIQQLCDISLDFPPVPGALVPREHILQLIEDRFDVAPVVIVDGKESSGKTTLLAQFALRHPNTSISLFVRPLNTLFYTLNSVRYDLCNQLSWILREKELIVEVEEADDALTQKLLWQLVKRARQKNETYKIIIDGLGDMPESDAAFKQQIINLLPFSAPKIHFLISGSQSEIPLPSGTEHRSAPAIPFTLPESVLFWHHGDNCPKEEMSLVEEAHHLCQGWPGRLTLLCKLCRAEGDTRRVLSEIDGGAANLFEVCWRQVAELENELPKTWPLLDALALLTWSRTIHTPHDLARILKISPVEMGQALRQLSFLRFKTERTAIALATVDVDLPPSNSAPEQEELLDGEVHFFSESFRSFAESKLLNRKTKANDLHIDDLLARLPQNQTQSRAASSSDGDASKEGVELAQVLTELPHYLHQAGRQEDILKYLGPHELTQILETTHSLSMAQATATMGLQAAKELHRDRELFQFCVQKSALAELEDAQIWRSEARARMAVRDYDAALALAQSARLREDRLHLLVIIARAKIEQNLSVESEVLEQIRGLCREIAPATMRDRAIEIAGDLLRVDPDLALQLVEDASCIGANGERDANALDSALAAIHIGTVIQNFHEERQHEREHRPQTSLENLSQRIQDPAIRRFLSTASLFYGSGRWSAERILQEIERLPSPDSQLWILRQWAQGNVEAEAADQVITAALRLIVESGTYTLVVRDLRELAAPLPFLQNDEVKRELVGRFDTLRGALTLAASEDDTILQMLLAQTEASYDKPSARLRVVDVYYRLSQLDDVGVKSACFSRLLASLEDVDPNQEFEYPDKTHSSSSSELNDAFDQLLKASADHHEATRGVVRALAKSKPDLALELVSRLNTVARRDSALVDFVDSALRVAPSRLDLRSVEDAFARFDDPDWHDYALIEATERLESIVEDAVTSQTAFPLDKAAPLLERVRSIGDLESRCRSLCRCWKMRHRLNTQAALEGISQIEADLEKAWDGIDTAWLKVDVGFEIASSLSEIAPEIAHSYISKTEEFRSDLGLDNTVGATSHLACLLLAIRSFAGLLPRQMDKTADFDRLVHAISSLPSNVEKVRLFTDFALRCAEKQCAARRPDLCRRIVDNYIYPLLDLLEDWKVEYQFPLAAFAAPALYQAHGPSALNYLSKLPLRWKEESFEAICRFLLLQKSPFDPVDAPPRHAYALFYSDAVTMCDIMDKMDYDSSIYHYMTAITDSATGRNSTITNPQKMDLASRFEGLISAKFPNQRHIRHEGYVVAARSQIARLRSASNVRPLPDWNILVVEASQLPNLADQAYVLSIVAISMHSARVPLERIKPLFEQAEKIIESIPLAYDQIDRYESLMQTAGEIDQDLAFIYAEKILKMTEEVKNPRSARVQQRVIDALHRFDPNRASQVAAQMDDDPARENLKNRLEMLNLRRRLVEPQVTADQVAHELAESLRSQYTNAAWTLLGQLNSGRISHQHRDRAYPFVEVAASGTMRDTYRIMAYVIENSVRRHSDTDQADSLLRPIYDAMMMGAELALRMAARNARRLERTLKNATSTQSDDNGAEAQIIGVGDHEIPLHLLSDWVKNEAEEYLTIADCYLNPNEICQILWMVREKNPELHVTIFSGFESWDKTERENPQEAITTCWKQAFDEPPPDTFIVLAGTETFKSPLHDRYWFTKERCITTGTSVSGFGKRIHSIISMSSQSAQQHKEEIDRYLRGEVRVLGSERLRSKTFYLEVD